MNLTISNLETYAESELRRAGLYDKDSDYGGLIAEATMKLIKVFADEGHSGYSAPMAIKIFEKLANFEPLSPLTGEDDEWNEVGTGVYQNKRCFHVFKSNNRFNGQAYDSEGKIFRHPDGGCYMNSESAVPITFPYVPKREYVDAKKEEE